MPFPFEFHLETLPPFQIVYNLQEICRDEIYSFAGILIKMKRNSVGQLLCGYYYPTTSFALLSMISYLIKPEKVNLLRKHSSLLRIFGFFCDLYLQFIALINLWNKFIDLRILSKCLEGPFLWPLR